MSIIYPTAQTVGYVSPTYTAGAPTYVPAGAPQWFVRAPVAAPEDRLARALRELAAARQRVDATPAPLVVRQEGDAWCIEGGEGEYRYGGKSPVPALNQLRAHPWFTEAVDRKSHVPILAGGQDVGVWRWVDASAQEDTEYTEEEAANGYAGVLITEKHIDEMIANLAARAHPIPLDGVICGPHESMWNSSAPAPGWGYVAAKVFDGTGRAHLFLLCHVAPDVADAMDRGHIAFGSIAFMANGFDPYTDKDIGAELLSYALTNDPFVKGLMAHSAVRALGRTLQFGRARTLTPEIGETLAKSETPKAREEAVTPPSLKDVLAAHFGKSDASPDELMKAVGEALGCAFPPTEDGEEKPAEDETATDEDKDKELEGERTARSAAEARVKALESERDAERTARAAAEARASAAEAIVAKQSEELRRSALRADLVQRIRAAGRVEPAANIVDEDVEMLASLPAERHAHFINRAISAAPVAGVSLANQPDSAPVRTSDENELLKVEFAAVSREFPEKTEAERWQTAYDRARKNGLGKAEGK